ncbi:18320_t:CDS:2 [Gigaspora margarita]|uniref:18320_t:CDS:1 n=1 Tax=Gigaspora margarita TaxID=4874 RepID=A0ABN7UR57_GIGMA|nr:18320_t:CDS:2 [Gigaspora margarita]
MIEFAGCAKTPHSWLTALVNYYNEDKKHIHEFFLSKYFGDRSKTVLICKKCHKRFTLITSEHGICVANPENNLHHLHTTTLTKTNIASQCCYCNFTVNVVIHEPFIDIQIFDDLQKRRFILTYSPLARKTNGVDNEPMIDLFDTLDTFSRIVENFIHSINSDDAKRKIYINSKVFFDNLGYKLVDDQNFFEPPPFTNDYIVKFQHVSEEIDMKVMDMSEKTFKTFRNPYKYKKPYQRLQFILGTEYDPRYRTFLPSFNPIYATLGCVSDMNDEILEWAYTKAIEESPEKIPEYLQAIYEVSKERNSEPLRNLVLEQTQEGAADGSRITLL